MSKTENLLEFTEKDRDLCYTNMYQLDDGTIFYYNYYNYKNPKVYQRLFVRHQGVEIEAILPIDDKEQKYLHIETHENALYFAVKQKVYKAAFSPLDGMTVTVHRDLNEKTSLSTRSGRIAIEHNFEFRKAWIYRLSDEFPIPVAVSHNKFKELNDIEWTDTMATHRDVAIFVKVRRHCTVPIAHKISNTAILIEMPPPNLKLHQSKQTSDIFASDFLPFVYITQQNNLFILNTDSLEFLPKLLCGGPTDLNITSIAGVHGGHITVYNSVNSYVAELPATHRAAIFAAELRMLRKNNREMTEDIHRLSKQNNNKQIVINSLEESRRHQLRLLNIAKESQTAMKDIISGMNVTLTNLEDENKKQAAVMQEFSRLKQLKVTNGIDSDMTELCSCSICCEVYDSVRAVPRMLACGHTFCAECISRLKRASAVACPTCKRRTMLHYENEPINRTVLRFPPVNYLALGMVEELMIKQSPSTESQEEKLAKMTARIEELEAVNAHLSKENEELRISKESETIEEDVRTESLSTSSDSPEGGLRRSSRVAAKRARPSEDANTAEEFPEAATSERTAQKHRKGTESVQEPDEERHYPKRKTSAHSKGRSRKE